MLIYFYELLLFQLLATNVNLKKFKLTYYDTIVINSFISCKEL